MNGKQDKKSNLFYAVRTAETIQAAERVAAIPSRMPGALLHPKMATRAMRSVAAMMRRDEVIGLVLNFEFRNFLICPALWDYRFAIRFE